MSGEALDQRLAAPFTDDSPVHPGNRPANRPYRTASKRFELRLTAAQLDAWRTIVARQDVSLADLVRVASSAPGRERRVREGQPDNERPVPVTPGSIVGPVAYAPNAKTREGLNPLWLAAEKNPGAETLRERAPGCDRN